MSAATRADACRTSSSPPALLVERPQVDCVLRVEAALHVPVYLLRFDERVGVLVLIALDVPRNDLEHLQVLLGPYIAHIAWSHNPRDEHTAARARQNRLFALGALLG